MEYTYKPGARIKTPASIAGAVCERLASDGKLTPEALLNESRSEDAPLHGEFEWDDTTAAEKYRINQAATIIRMLVIKPNEKPEIITRAFVRATNEVHEFVPYRRAISSIEGRDILLRTARRELQSFTYKYQSLSELANVNEAINKFLSEEET